MKIVIAPDSFKGSMTSMQAARAIENGIKKAVPHAETVIIPIADGGEGTLESLVIATNGKRIETTVLNPIGEKIKAEYGVLGDNKTCVIEMATASGLYLIPKDKRNPLVTTTMGTGQLIIHALNNGYRKFILALGGSATNDGGAGMLQALGMKLLDNKGNQIHFGGGELSKIRKIDDSDFDSRISDSTFLIASDVKNPFVGKDGATYIFGPQKGATEEIVKILDNNLTHFADVIEKHFSVRLHEREGAGAAGGIGGAFQAFFPSETKQGIEVVMKYTKLSERLQNSTLVFTGEGRFDSQTAFGKAPMGIAKKAKEKQIPVIVLCGSIGEGIEELYSHGIHSVHSIVNGPMSLQSSMEKGPQLLEQKAEQIIRTIMITNK